MRDLNKKLARISFKAQMGNFTLRCSLLSFHSCSCFCSYAQVAISWDCALNWAAVKSFEMGPRKMSSTQRGVFLNYSSPLLWNQLDPPPVQLCVIQFLNCCLQIAISKNQQVVSFPCSIGRVKIFENRYLGHGHNHTYKVTNLHVPPAGKFNRSLIPSRLVSIRKCHLQLIN